MEATGAIAGSRREGWAPEVGGLTNQQPDTVRTRVEKRKREGEKVGRKASCRSARRCSFSFLRSSRMGRLSLFNVPGPRSGPFGPLTNGNLPPSPVSDDHPAPVPFKLHAQARLDEETGKPVIGPPAPDPPFPQRYTYRLNSYSLAPSDPSTIDGAQVERQEEANDEELTAFFEGEWGGVEIGPAVAERRSVTLKPKRVVRFRSFWMKHVEVRVPGCVG